MIITGRFDSRRYPAATLLGVERMGSVHKATFDTVDGTVAVAVASGDAVWLRDNQSEGRVLFDVLWSRTGEVHISEHE